VKMPSAARVRSLFFIGMFLLRESELESCMSRPLQSGVLANRRSDLEKQCGAAMPVREGF
jgi:hypothetical protein